MSQSLWTRCQCATSLCEMRPRRWHPIKLTAQVISAASEYDRTMGYPSLFDAAQIAAIQATLAIGVSLVIT